MVHRLTILICADLVSVSSVNPTNQRELKMCSSGGEGNFLFSPARTKLHFCAIFTSLMLQTSRQNGNYLLMKCLNIVQALMQLHGKLCGFKIEVCFLVLNIWLTIFIFK